MTIMFNAVGNVPVFRFVGFNGGGSTF